MNLFKRNNIHNRLDNTFFSDAEVMNCIKSEYERQLSQIQLIASENFASNDVLYAQGSTLTNKYAEGYSGKRYYSGCINVDNVENLAIERLKKLFNVNYTNVQPHSGSQANQAVFLALLNPGDVILGMSMDSGGHLTHGANVSLSGKWFHSESYQLDSDTLKINYDQIEEKAIACKPKLIIAGYSSCNQKLDFAKFRKIADKVGAYLLADVAHISGIIAAGYHQNPAEYADVITSTTHKTLRGPRGGVVMCNDKEMAKKINSAVFPGIQGGPLMHVVAAKAVAFREALQDSFKKYIKAVLDNAVVLSDVLQSRGYNTLGNTENHIVIIDLRSKNITGKLAADVLESCGIVVNKNVIPFDTVSPFITSGIRMGTAACTTLGFDSEDFIKIGNLIADIFDNLSNSQSDFDSDVYLKRVAAICSKNKLNN